MAHIVICRICKTNMDIEVLEENKDWIQPSKGWYYHKKCYEDWKGGAKNESAANPEETKIPDEDWISLIYDYLARDLKMPYDYFLCEAQRKKLIKEKKTNKGIYFALRYFYEVKNGDKEKARGGIGIIAYIYNESCMYWANLERKQEGILLQIEKQLRERSMREPIHLKKKKENKKPKYNLDDILKES